MSDISVPVDSVAGVSPNEAQRVLDFIKKVDRFGHIIAALTSTKTDDQVVAWADKFIAVAEPFVADGSLMDLLNMVLDLFSNKSPAEVKSIVAAMTAYPA